MKTLQTRSRRSTFDRASLSATRSVIESLERRTLFSAPVFGATIAQENQLAGTPDTVWDISNAGDPSIQGYGTSISVNVGQALGLKINDTARAPYHIDIYRM